MDVIHTMKYFSTCPGVTGYESNFSSILEDMFKDVTDEVTIDNYYNVIGLKKGKTGTKKIMITAHMDEIGLIVTGIDKNGFISFSSMGGIDPKILLAQEVIIHGREDLYGLIGAKPPHLLTPDEVSKAVKWEDLAIDAGMDYESIKKLVEVGDVITFVGEPIDLQNGRVAGKTFDNRCGVAILYQLAAEFSMLNHSADIYLVATTQEEFELTGATTASYNLRPDLAIVIDTCHGDTPGADKDRIHNLGKGPKIGISSTLHKTYTKAMINFAKENEIPFQIGVETVSSGTEVWATQISRAGIPTLLVSIPLRYMHTTIETIDQKDVKNAVKLISQYILKEF